MKNLFVSYELALLAKERGFDERCLAYYGYKGKFIECPKEHYRNIELEHFYTAPIYQQLVDWFREKHKIFVHVFAMMEEDSYKTCWGWNILELEWGTDKEHHITNSVSTREYGLQYYGVLNKALEEAFKLI